MLDALDSSRPDTPVKTDNVFGQTYAPPQAKNQTTARD